MKEFFPEIIEEIDHYIYSLADPVTGVVFYIGRGKGNRCFDHSGDESETEKGRKIKELLKHKATPRIELLRYGLSEDQAKLLEATLIDFVGLDNLTNRMRGYHESSEVGAAVEDIIAKYMAKDVEIDDNDGVVLISIGKSFNKGMSDEELYDYSRGVWRIDWKKHRPRFALIIFQRIIREVYEIKGNWLVAGATEYKHRELAEVKIPGRWEFTGKKASEEIRHKYIGMSARKYFPKGSRNPIKFEHC